jgi:hypothetical protein
MKNPWKTVFSLVLVALLWCALAVPQAALAEDKDLRKATSAIELAAQIEQGAGTIVLAGGDYGFLDLRGTYSRAKPLVIRSENRSNPARFSGLLVAHAQHVVLQSLVFDYKFQSGERATLAPFNIGKSQHIIVRDSVFDGDIMRGSGTDEDSYPTGTGLYVRNSSDVVVERSVFRKFLRGLIVRQSNDVIVRSNDISQMRMDGMNITEVQSVRIDGNHIHDFKGRKGWDDHRDMIQFWTRGNVKQTRDVVIRNNVLNSGGGKFTQSIFMRNEVVDTGKAGAKMFYKNVEISNNFILNAHLHGITIGETNGLKIQNNTVVRNAASKGPAKNPPVWIPRINVKPKSRNVRVQRNVTSSITGFDGQKDWRVDNNLFVQDSARIQPGFYGTVFGPASIKDPRKVISFAQQPDSALEISNIGIQGLVLPRK